MNSEEKFFIDVKRLLDEAANSLSAGTVARLRQARRAAMEQRASHRPPSRAGWWWSAGGVAMAGVILTVVGLLWISTPDTPLLSAGVSDLELLGAQENPDFFAELEFYEWLESQENAS